MAAEINGWNERIIAEFRANAGYVAWSSPADLAAGRPVPPLLPSFRERAGVPIILVHHVGIKTQRERVNPMMYQPLEHGVAVFATYGGSTHHPAWYRNLMAHPQTTIEVGTDKLSVIARAAEGAERERIWTKQVALMPTFAEFETAAGRQIPVVVLECAHHNPIMPAPEQ